jgi:hypothetical protein
MRKLFTFTPDKVNIIWIKEKIKINAQLAIKLKL